MANLTFDGDAELVKQLEKLANYDEIAKTMLKAAAPTLIKRLGQEFAQRINEETGNSVKMTTLDKNDRGWYCVIRPDGTSSTGHWKYSNKGKTEKQLKSRKRVKLTNMDLVAYFEYGTDTMPARPMIQKSVNGAEAEVNEKLQEAFNEAVGQ